MTSYELRQFATPDEVREFPMGRGDVVNIGGGQVLLITLQPGWRWSEHLKPVTGTEWCEAPHFQYVIAGRIHVVTSDGEEFEAGPGSVNVLQPGHDAWVVGEEPVTAVDWGGAHVWAKRPD